MVGRETILTLPNTFFVNAFLRSAEISVRSFKEQNHYRFLANLIIEVSASLPENKYLAVTSSAVFEEFERKLESKGLQRGLEETLRIFRGLVFIVDVKSINRLGDQESMVAIANRLYESSAYDPIIIVDPRSRDNYREATKRFYGNSQNSGHALEIPFKIFDPREAKGFLEAKFPNESSLVIQKTDPPFRVF